MKRNIIYITGDDSYGIEYEVRRWKQVFSEKYSELNIEMIRLENRSEYPLIRDNLTSAGLFSDKRLFIFSGGTEKKIKSGGFEEILEGIASSIPDDHFCLFYNISSKEEGLTDWLKNNTDVRTINTVWSIDTWGERFKGISRNRIKEVLDAYFYSVEKTELENRNPYIGHTIGNTFECIEIGSIENIHDILVLTGGGKMFDMIDLLLSDKIHETILLMRKILETMNIVEFLNSLIGLLRSHIYIAYLKNRGKTQSEIQNILIIHPFVLKKSLSSKISYKKLTFFYKEIITINMAYKRGKGLQDGELGRIFSIEIALMCLKNGNISYNELVL